MDQRQRTSNNLQTSPFTLLDPILTTSTGKLDNFLSPAVISTTAATCAHNDHHMSPSLLTSLGLRTNDASNLYGSLHLDNPFTHLTSHIVNPSKWFLPDSLKRDFMSTDSSSSIPTSTWTPLLPPVSVPIACGIAPISSDIPVCPDWSDSVQLKIDPVHRSSQLSSNPIQKKQHPCSHCTKSFRRASDLVKHKRTHTGEKPFVCAHCGRAFADSSSLATHKRIHTGERPYNCSVCGKNFTVSSSLVKHKRIHTGERPYQCLVCGRTFSDSSSYRAHRKRNHCCAFHHHHHHNQQPPPTPAASDEIYLPKPEPQ